MATDFHFSPRPNRAHEIRWRAWSAGAFEEARARDKPILLSISAVWCHWCHVMDETTYSDPAVIETINAGFVPIRVDNDRRPDVNARYNQGGWPTTAFLTPDGSLLAGATYLPPAQLRAALQQISEFYQTNADAIAQRSAELRETLRTRTLARGELAAATIDDILAAIERQFDEEYGGFGTQPKFPMTDVLELLLQEWRVTRNQRLYDMLARTLNAMSSGGMYDHVEGGFFRYSTTRDWSIPHFEKMTEDHGALLRILAVLVRETNRHDFRSTLASACGYMRNVLYNSQTRLFCGSQDADETYYALPLEERRAMQAPYVDRTSYSNWSAAAAAAFVCAGNVLADERLMAVGIDALDALHDARDESGLLYHVVEPDGTKNVRGLLADQAAYLRALLDVHEQTGEPRFFERALAITDLILRTFLGGEGGFSDHASFEERIGTLDVVERPLGENCSIADSLLRLAAVTSDDKLRHIAEETLALFTETARRSGLFGAPFARALRRYVSEPHTLTLTGTPHETQTLRDVALALPDPLLVIRTSPAADGQVPGAAYYCAGTACAPPATDAASLRDAYERFSTV